MGGIRIKTKNRFENTTRYFNKLKGSDLRIYNTLKKHGEEGVKILAEATPKRTGLTAESWYYEVKKNSTGYALEFNNSNIQNGVQIAVLLQFGHGTGWGGYVQGVDYINPALSPIFKKISDDIEKELRV